jgi:hypothetical protein
LRIKVSGDLHPEPPEAVRCDALAAAPALIATRERGRFDNIRVMGLAVPAVKSGTIGSHRGQA